MNLELAAQAVVSCVQSGITITAQTKMQTIVIGPLGSKYVVKSDGLEGSFSVLYLDIEEAATEFTTMVRDAAAVKFSFRKD